MAHKTSFYHLLCYRKSLLTLDVKELGGVLVELVDFECCNILNVM